MPGDDIFDSIRFRNENILFEQFPKLSCSMGNQLDLSASDLKLDSDRALHFQGNGQISTTGSLRVLTGSPTTERLTLLSNGNVGIGTSTPTTKLEVVGAVKATSFQGDGSTLTGVVKTLDEVVKKAGDTMTGALVLQHTLTVNGNVGIGTTTPAAKLEVNGTVKATAFQGDGSQLTGISRIGTGEVSIAQLKATVVAEGSVVVSDTATVKIQSTRPNEQAFYLASISCVSTSSSEALPFPVPLDWRFQAQAVVRNSQSSSFPPFPVTGNVHFLVIEIPEILRDPLTSLGVSLTVAYKVYRLSET